MQSELFLLWLKIKQRRQKRMFKELINTSAVTIVKVDCPVIGKIHVVSSG